MASPASPSSSTRSATAYISEYLEGTGFNKAIEIKNPSNQQVNVAGCFVRTNFSDGTSQTVALPPVNFIQPADVLVICHATADANVLFNCDLPIIAAALTFDGDDAIELVCGSDVLDVVGQVGFDPDLEWGTGLLSTADNTLRRKCGIAHGDIIGTNDFEPTLAAEWVGFAIDTAGGLGSPACAP